MEAPKGHLTELGDTVTPLEALPGAVVAPIGGVGIGVAAAVARLAGVAQLERVAVVTVGASAIFGRNQGGNAEKGTSE